MRSLLLITFTVTTMLSCGPKQEKIRPSSVTITESVYASGIVKSRNQYQVYSPVNGLIQQIFVSEGDTVKKDDPILRVTSETARLNSENAQLAADYSTTGANADKLNELQANIQFLKSKMQNDSILVVRQRNLWEKQIGTRNELDQRELSYKNDVATYKAALFRFKDLQKQLTFNEAQAKNNLQLSKTTVGDFTIKSQVNGTIYSLGKETGEMVNTQSPVAVIGSTGEFFLELQVDEYDFDKIIPGQRVLITMDSYKNKVFEATISRIIPFLNDRTRSFTVEAQFNKLPPSLYPNLTVEANIILQTKENTLTIPAGYLLNDSLVMMPSGEKKKVVTGLKDYQKVEIISGLTKEDEIIKPMP